MNIDLKEFDREYQDALLDTYNNFRDDKETQNILIECLKRVRRRLAREDKNV